MLHSTNNNSKRSLYGLGEVMFVVPVDGSIECLAGVHTPIKILPCAGGFILQCITKLLSDRMCRD